MAPWSLPEPARRRPLGLADGLALLVLAASLLALHQYCVVDTRPPADLGHYYRDLPQLYAVLVREGPSAELGRAIGQAGGAYNLGLAALMAAFGVSEELLDRVELGWLSLLLLGTWGTTRALAGRGAALAAITLAAMMPAFQVGARTHWLHFVEAAAVAGALWAWTADARLDHRRTQLALATATVFCVSLRTTGLLYMGSMLAMALATVGWQRRRRLLLPAIGLALGLVVVLPKLGDYVGGKLAVRQVYQSTVRPLLPSLAEQTYMAPGLLILGGLVLALALRRRALLQAPNLLLAAWAAGSLVLGGAFHVGIDNFPLLYVAAAVLAGQGLEALPGRRLLAPAGLAACGLALAAPFMQPPQVELLIPALSPAIVSFEPTHFLRPQSRALRVETIQPYLDQACETDDGICTILATTGLFNLNREDDASLALFLAGVGGVKVLNGGQWWTPDDLTTDDAIEGIVVMDCHQIGQALNSFLERERAVGALALAVGADKLGQIGPPAPCPQTWYRLDGDDSRVPVLEFARSYDWQIHVLPQVLPPLAPRRARRAESP